MYTVKYEFRNHFHSISCESVEMVWELLGILKSWFNLKGEVWKDGNKIDYIPPPKEEREVWTTPSVVGPPEARSKRKFYLTYEGRRQVWERTGRVQRS